MMKPSLNVLVRATAAGDAASAASAAASAAASGNPPLSGSFRNNYVMRSAPGVAALQENVARCMYLSWQLLAALARLHGGEHSTFH